MSQEHDVVTFQLQSIFTFFFIMLGPLRLIGPFAKLTAGRPESECRSIALRGIAIATLTVLLAGLVGSVMLVKWQVAVGALALAGGILFFLVALKLVLDPYTQGSRPSDALSRDPPSEPELVRQLVPAIVSPWGITAVIFFLTLEPDRTWPIVGMLIGVMALDLLAMIFARPILRVFAFPLQLVGTVLSVLQVALSVQVIALGVRLIAIERFGAHFPK
jgi:multiple antibiotic resistance protein